LGAAAKGFDKTGGAPNPMKGRLCPQHTGETAKFTNRANPGMGGIRRESRNVGGTKSHWVKRKGKFASVQHEKQKASLVWASRAGRPPKRDCQRFDNLVVVQNSIGRKGR